MNIKHIAMIASAASLLAAAPVWAHHAFAAEFDAKKPIHLEGVVSKVELINPHSWIHVDIKDAGGAHSRRQAGLAGHLDQRHDYAARAARVRWRESRAYGRRGGSLRESVR